MRIIRVLQEGISGEKIMVDLQSRNLGKNEYGGLGKDARCYFDGTTGKIYGYVDSINSHMRFCCSSPIGIETLKKIIDDAENRFIYLRPTAKLSVTN